MDLSVAMVVLLLKIGIKQLDPNYDIQSFLEDIVNALGEKTGKKIATVIFSSKKNIDDVLQDNVLKELGIPEDRMESVRYNTNAILKFVQIDNNMLIEHNCDVSAIVDFLLESNIGKAGIRGDEAAINDVRIVLIQIVRKLVDLAKEHNEFIAGILLDVKNRVDLSSKDITTIKETTFQTYSNTEELKKQVENLARDISYLQHEQLKKEEQSKTSERRWQKKVPSKKKTAIIPLTFLPDVLRKEIRR